MKVMISVSVPIELIGSLPRLENRALLRSFSRFA